MANLDNYSDAELGRMLKNAAGNMTALERERVSTFETFRSWLNLVGLGFIAEALTIGSWAWDRIKSIWSKIFGSSEKSSSNKWW